MLQILNLADILGGSLCEIAFPVMTVKQRATDSTTNSVEKSCREFMDSSRSLKNTDNHIIDYRKTGLKNLLVKCNYQYNKQYNYLPNDFKA